MLYDKNDVLFSFVYIWYMGLIFRGLQTKISKYTNIH